MELENYTTDKPVTLKVEDKFQRYKFSKRIAETITNRKDKDCIVFGLYGAWGEGKSSVINFIKKEIELNDQFIQISFNPWRFTDESALLSSFFNTLALEIKKTISDDQITAKTHSFFKKRFEKNKDPLKTNKEAIGDLIQKYGKIVSIFGAGETAEAIGKAISDVDIETLKSRIENLLNEQKKRIVIYLDDIDRLDKNEIHSIFRLVKLTGDFSYTSYILAFDEKMVAEAIGERFGGGNEKAGNNFLEKIVQVPINIPIAQPEALKNYCLSLINNALKSNTTELDNDATQRFIYQFTTNILPKLKTPRLAVRYGNTISFAIPLLKGEVNITDLLLIEAIKIFYPEYYKLIKLNPKYFISSDADAYFGRKKLDEEFKLLFDELSKECDSREKKQIEFLISNLFPTLEAVFNNYNQSDFIIRQWKVQKRIVSAQYFDRYFSFSIADGDISDLEFDSVISMLGHQNPTDIKVAFEKIIKNSNHDKFITKLRDRESNFNWDNAKILSKIIADLNDYFPKIEGGLMGFGFETPYGQASIFIYQLFKNNKSEKDIFEFACELIEYTKDFDFAYSVNNWLRSNEGSSQLFNEHQYIKMGTLLLNKAIRNSKKSSIFELYSNQIGYLTVVWTLKNKIEFENYTNQFLNINKSNIGKLIYSYIPTGTSNIMPKPHKVDLKQENFEFLKKHFDLKNLYNKIIENLSLDEIDVDKLYWIDFGENEFTEINMFRQFIHWYNIDKQKKINL